MVSSAQSIVDQSENNFDEVFSVNVKGLFIALQQEIRQMLRQGFGGSIVVSTARDTRCQSRRIFERLSFLPTQFPRTSYGHSFLRADFGYLRRFWFPHHRLGRDARSSAFLYPGSIGDELLSFWISDFHAISNNSRADIAGFTNTQKRHKPPVNAAVWKSPYPLPLRSAPDSECNRLSISTKSR